MTSKRDTYKQRGNLVKIKCNFVSTTSAMTMLLLGLVFQSTVQAQDTVLKPEQKTMPKGTTERPPKSLSNVSMSSALTSDVVIGDPNSNNPEISAVAIPAGGTCTAGSNKTATGARLISSVGRESGTPNTYVPWSYVKQGLNADFSPNGAATDLVPSVNQALQVTTKYDPNSINRALPGATKYYPVTDNQFVRLSNGDLITARMSYIERNTAPYWNGSSGGRVGLLTVRSKDCGETWQFNGFLDPAKITLTFRNKAFAGAGAYPQKDWTNDAHTSGQLIQGGGDRPEFYADPWDGQTVYASLWFGANDDRTSGYAPANKSLPSVFNALIFSSPDGGKTWGTEPIAMFNSNPVPIAMTTTRARRLFLFNCVGGTPTLHYVKDGKYVQSWPVFYGDVKNPESACAGNLEGQAATGNLTTPGYLLRVLRDVSISRVEGSGSRDTVRVVYPAVSGGRRVARVVVVSIQEAASLVLSKVHQETIAAASATGNIVYPTFIEADRVDLPKRSATNTAVLYWYETANAPVNPGQPPSVRLFTRYSVFREGGNVPGGIASKPQDLSVTNRTRRYWSPANNEFVGDYMRGAFAYDGKLRFIAQWPEREAGTFLRIRYNVVTVEP